MGTLRVLLFLVAFFVVAFGVGQYWKLKPPTAQSHVIRGGETAILTADGTDQIWVAVTKDDSYTLQKAMVAKDETALSGFAAREAAFPVASGTRVRVMGQITEHRRVEVLDGPAAGRAGWVESEYLQVPKPWQR